MVVTYKRNHPTYGKKKSADDDYLALVVTTASKFKSQMLKYGKTTAYTKCPKCGHKLYGSLAPRNNHLHMKCESPNCIVFME